MAGCTANEILTGVSTNEVRLNKGTNIISLKDSGSNVYMLWNDLGSMQPLCPQFA